LSLSQSRQIIVWRKLQNTELVACAVSFQFPGESGDNDGGSDNGGGGDKDGYKLDVHMTMHHKHCVR
jgi:hypothetical protein